MITLDTHVTRPPRSEAFAAWSPDGRALVYGHFDEGRNSFSLRVVDVATESIREITPEGSFGDRAQARSAYLDWSPTGEHIAFAVDDGAYRSWIGVVRPDGSDLKVLREHSATFYDLRFSADGQYLAATFYDFTESQKLVLYDAASGEERLFLPGVSHYDWSPTGHALVLASEAGLQLLAEPGDSQSEAEQLVDEPCSSVVWGPVP
jgi:Tol biopolymer transport system component